MRMLPFLALSLALHAAFLFLLPAPHPSGRASPARTSIEVRLTDARDAAVLPRPEKALPPEIPVSPDLSRGIPSPAPESRIPESAPRTDTAPKGRTSSDSDLPDLPSAEPAASGWAESVGLPQDEAASLLLARVEAALRYPESARRRGTEGVVGLRILLDGGGALSDLRVVRSSGSALLDRAAREAVEASLPVPNTTGAPLSFELAVRFSLKTKTAAQ